MTPKVPKCCSLAVQASSGRVYDPQLQLCGQTIPFIGSSTFRFLGAPATINNSQEKARCALLEKLQTYPTVKSGCHSAHKSPGIEDLLRRHYPTTDLGPLYVDPHLIGKETP